jgi:hypothetical protein
VVIPTARSPSAGFISVPIAAGLQRFAQPIDYCFKHHGIYLLLLELAVVERVPEEAKCYNNHWVSG